MEKRSAVETWCQMLYLSAMGDSGTSPSLTLCVMLVRISFKFKHSKPYWIDLVWCHALLLCKDSVALVLVLFC